MNIHEVIRERVFSERTTEAQEKHNRYTFRVHPQANKIQIRRAVEQAFRVTVLDVNTMWVRGKRRVYGRLEGRGAHWKKAIVTVAPGQEIKIS